MSRAEFQDPFRMSPDEIWDALCSMSRNDPMVHAVMVAQFRHGFDREYAALALAYALVQQLHATQEEFGEWIKFTPRPVGVKPGPEFLRCRMLTMENQ